MNNTLNLTLDISALQKLPEVAPAADGTAMLGAGAMRCSIDGPTCCCSRITDN
ncbi:hypothetical protein GCM10029976_009590 [Kribbella albertanoniae]|uniref:hypothetical protein n=1 Tax=Kribbella albertanoniae TaxID=1266829 RepID=UPI0014055C3B|nr:hypothetical protein [Kribbella albertanoniae]